MHRNFIIRRFIATAVMFVSVSYLDAAESAVRLFNGTDYAALRKQLRAFYPDECHGACKLAAQTNSVQLIARGIDESAIGGALGYVRRPGEHGMAADEWRRLMDFSDKIFSAR